MPSQIRERVLAKLIFVETYELMASLITSASTILVRTSGVPLSCQQEISAANRSPAFDEYSPISLNDGSSMSSMILPSAVNSGQ